MSRRYTLLCNDVKKIIKVPRSKTVLKFIYNYINKDRNYFISSDAFKIDKVKKIIENLINIVTAHINVKSKYFYHRITAQQKDIQKIGTYGSSTLRTSLRRRGALVIGREAVFKTNFNSTFFADNMVDRGYFLLATLHWTAGLLMYYTVILRSTLHPLMSIENFIWVLVRLYSKSPCA